MGAICVVWIHIGVRGPLVVLGWEWNILRFGWLVKLSFLRLGLVSILFNEERPLYFVGLVIKW